MITTDWQIVRAALWGEPIPDLSYGEKEWKTFIQICAQQGLGPLVFPSLMERCGEGLRSAMKQICVQTLQQQVALQYTLSVAWRALDSAGIHAVLMKGAGLAAYYPKPYMRPWGDVDIYVGDEQYHASCAAMRETFPDALKFDEELDHYKHYNLIADGISLEIHRASMGLMHPIDALRYARMEREGMARSEEVQVTDDGLQVRVPEPTFNALMVMLHAWEHLITAGANIRQLCDLALFLHARAEDIDRRSLKRNLRLLHLTDVWRVYMSAMVIYLGLPEKDAPFYKSGYEDCAQRLIQEILSPSGKGKKIVEKNRFVRKLRTMCKRLRNARALRAYSKPYAHHVMAGVLLNGLLRLFAKDRKWE